MSRFDGFISQVFGTPVQRVNHGIRELTADRVFGLPATLARIEDFGLIEAS